MARKARRETGPGLYHVFARGTSRDLVFRDDEDRRDYLRRLRAVTERMGWKCLSFCLMGNHVHMLIETTRPNLGDGMRVLQGAYAQRFNRRYGRWGHLWGDRYGSATITSDAHFKAAVRYIARNPIAAGLADGLGEWRWDSWRETVSPPHPRWRIIDVARLLQLFDTTAPDPIARLADFVAATDPLPP